MRNDTIESDVSSPFPSFTLMMEVIVSPKRRFLQEPHGDIPEDGILHSYLHESLKSYIAITGWSLAET
jgi:hypothetical protein